MDVDVMTRVNRTKTATATLPWLMYPWLAELQHLGVLRAMEIVRARADEFGIDPEKIGFMGFSAGGTVTMHVAYHHGEDSRPAFVAPIYAAHRWFKDMAVTGPLPPAFIVAATDDQLNLAIDSIDIYQRWLKVNVPAELHMYARGGHGFGMRTQNLPSDTWIERFGDWLGTLE